MSLVETFNREHFGITYTLDEYYKNRPEFAQLKAVKKAVGA